MTRVAAIAIDAAEYWYVQQLIDRGELPNLARLQERSARFLLDTPMAYRSELSWARFLTGEEPFTAKNWAASMAFDPATYGLASTSATTRPPFYAFGPNAKVVTLDLIHSSLAVGVNGEQVVAWGSHSPQYPRCSQPTGLLTEIDRRFGTSPIFNNESDAAWYDPKYIAAVSEGACVAVRRRGEIGRWLLERNPDWDLFMTCVSEVHTGGHLLWHGVDPTSPVHDAPTAALARRCFDDIMRATDDFVGMLVDAFPDDTNVILFAHHGALPADDLLCTVLLPELMMRHHKGRSLFATPDVAAWRAAGCPAIVPNPDYTMGEYMTDHFADSAKQRLRRAVRNALPRATFERLRRFLGSPVPSPLSALDRPIPPESRDIEAEVANFEGPIDQPVSWYRRHWPTMPSFALPSFADGHVRINLVGREANGIVAPEDYGKAMDEVVELLGVCRDARTGDPILDRVERVREADPFDPQGPESDLLIFWRGAPDAIEHPKLGVIGPFPHIRVSHHSNNGFAFIAGPDIESGDRKPRSSTELTATVLSLMGRSPTGASTGLMAEL